jgi:hypothetical protein
MMVDPWFAEEALDLDANAGNAPPDFNHDRWLRLRRDQLGVDVIDPLGHNIGMAAARNNWWPVDGSKHVLVGELDHYYVYNGDGDEMDWNICLAPDAAFRFILDQVAETMSVDDREDDLVELRDGSGYAVECEITPDEDYWLNPYFPILPLVGSAPSPLIGRTVGVYGPWVRDHYHGGRPEIHPCEAIWWLSDDNPPNVAMSRLILVLQDDSERFARPEDYNGPIPRPWSAFPRRANITLALRLRTQDHMYFNLLLLHDREMANVADSEETTITGQFGGDSVVSITKQMEDPAKVRMRLGRIARDPDGTHLRCFLYVSIQVGRGDDGQEGHALLNLQTLS